MMLHEKALLGGADGSNHRHQLSTTSRNKRRLRLMSNSLAFLLLLLLTAEETSVVVMALSTNNKRSSNTKTKIAIVGGGISGLSCAVELAKDSSKEVTVFDTGRLRPGGRCSSRQVGDLPKEDEAGKAEEKYPLLSRFRYDHAAQVLVKPDAQQYPEFASQVQDWLERGIVKEFPQGSVCQLLNNNKVQPLLQTFYHGTHGMGSLATDLASQTTFTLNQDVWVSPSSGVRYQSQTGKWKLQAKGKTLGYYDQLVLAHNGKCADRIMSQTPAKDLHSLLRVNFSPTVSANGGTKMTLNSLYSMTMVVPNNSALSQALGDSVQCLFLSSHPNLRMISCQTRKYPSSDDYEVWNVLSSAKFAKQYKAPQEFLPEETISQVSSLLLQAVEEALKLPKIEPSEIRLQLWGAAVPLNVWPTDYLWDSQYQVGVCGDWLVEPSIAGAWTSGYKLAQHLKTSGQATNDVGLVGVEDGSIRFQRSESASKLGLVALPSNNKKAAASATASS